MKNSLEIGKMIRIEKDNIKKANTKINELRNELKSIHNLSNCSINDKIKVIKSDIEHYHYEIEWNDTEERLAEILTTCIKHNVYIREVNWVRNKYLNIILASDQIILMKFKDKLIIRDT